MSHAQILKKLQKKGFDTYTEYWTKLAKTVKKYQNVDLIYSANTITHIKNLDQVLSLFADFKQNGKLIIEDPSLLNCLKMAYDQFYNEHIYVFL